MIQSAHLINFQGHKDTLFEFSSGVNVIIGKTDSGKTSLVRAIDFVLNNNNKKGYRRKVNKKIAGDTSVTLDFEDGYVQRNKGKIDSYVIKKAGKKEKELKAFGTGVPEYVSSFLNMSSINLQKQLDSSFLLTNTAGQVAKHFNKIANLEQIDTSLQKINSMAKEVSHLLKFKKEDLKGKEEQLKEFADIPEIEEKIKQVEDAVEKKEALELYIQTVEKSLQKIRSYREEIKEKESILEGEEIVSETLTMFGDKEQLESEINNISSFLKTINSLLFKIESYKNILKGEKIITETLTLMKEYDLLLEDIDETEVVLYRYNDLSSRIKTNKTLIKDWEELFVEEIGDTCPLCGANKKHFKH